MEHVQVSEAQKAEEEYEKATVKCAETYEKFNISSHVGSTFEWHIKSSEEELKRILAKLVGFKTFEEKFAAMKVTNTRS